MQLLQILVLTSLNLLVAATAWAQEQGPCPNPGGWKHPELQRALNDHARWANAVADAEKNAEKSNERRAPNLPPRPRGTNLCNADLQNVDLTGRNLARAQLSGANLAAARLNRADLRDADLSGANLDGAKLVAARLEGATLSQAKLYGAVLVDAALDGADLEEPSFNGPISKAHGWPVLSFPMQI